jgi:TolA-binding protein
MHTKMLLLLTMLASTAPARAQSHEAERAMRDAERALRQAPRIAATVTPYVMRDVERAMADAQVALHAAPIGIEAALAGAQVALSMAPMALSNIDRALAGVPRVRFEAWDDGDDSFDTTPPSAWDQADPADSLYRAARQYLNRSDYVRASDLFGQIRNRYPKSTYAPDSYYWQAYALYRRGGSDRLRQAQSLLDEQSSKFASASTRKSGDSRSLETRVQGELARLGDAGAREELARIVNPPQPPQPPQAAETPRTPRPPQEGRAGRGPRCNDEDDVQATALSALMQMDDERAMPILKKVLARRDDESVCLRRKAVFIVSQVGGNEAESILLNAARTDPDNEVKGQAVFWLSQVDSDRAVVALDSILATSTDPEIQDKAVFALSQHDSRAARQSLRRYAERTNISSEIREKAVFWLGQSDDAEDNAFLRGLFPKVTDQELKEKILFSLSQNDDAQNSKFLGDVARNTNENIEIRKKALFWMGQKDDMNGSDIASLYGTFSDREIKEQLIFVLSQKDDKAAVDKLIDIAKREPDKELRKKAIFWLSQSDDPRVAEVLASLLEKP